MPSPETPHLLKPEDINREYPGLQIAVLRAADITTRYFRPFRSDVDIVKPPLFLCDTSDLSNFVSEVTSKSGYEQTEQRSHAHYQPIEGVIYGERESLAQELQRGQNGLDYVSIILTHEYLHAFTTVDEGDHTRTGFIQIPGKRFPHNLQPGKIYNVETLDTSGETNPVEIDALDERLTENAVQLATHLMLDEILFDKKKQYPFIILGTDLDKEHFTLIKKDKSMLKFVLGTLYRGDKQTLMRSLPFLGDPYLNMASLSSLSPSSDDFYTF